MWPVKKNRSFATGSNLIYRVDWRPRKIEGVNTERVVWVLDTKKRDRSPLSLDFTKEQLEGTLYNA